jgi:heat shock protein HtpX
MSSTNLFEQQAANRRKSRLIVASFLLFFAWLGFGGDAILYFAAKDGHAIVPWKPGFPILGVVLTVVAIGIVAYVRKTGAQKVLWATGARQLEEPQTDGEQQLMNVAEEMSIAAGVPMPKVWVIDDPDPNAFAAGNDPTVSHLAVTTGLLATLDRDELQAVIGHEYGHIKNLDPQLMTFLAALVGAVVLMRDGMARVLWHSGGRIGGGSRSRGKKSDGGQVYVALLVLWVISWALAPLAVNLLALWVSRSREFLADAMSAQFTRNPNALASALEKIEGAVAPTTSIKAGVGHLCIADPKGRALADPSARFVKAFATHPPMALRIQRLRAMAYSKSY